MSVREQALRSVVTFINGITASTVASRVDWPPSRQTEQLRLQLQLLRAWAATSAAAVGVVRRARRASA